MPLSENLWRMLETASSAETETRLLRLSAGDRLLSECSRARLIILLIDAIDSLSTRGRFGDLASSISTSSPPAG
jgi:hypothetical protein